ncbi:MAG TPA: S-adenosylmethionine:tRNA ribosyltransferase-isomerase, partial [Blastocatellia bacterium]|nr:S-adenosylmethionine:tRNA ribosyltransferase-isomerase [Blastocatellia bacterium]
TLLMGRLQTAGYYWAGRVDAFAGTAIDPLITVQRNLGNGKTRGKLGIGSFFNASSRASNAIAYVTPNFSGFSAAINHARISESAATAINRAHQAGNRVVAVGTTSVRALESAADENGRLRAGNNSTELFIYPGYRFRAVDSLLTNFHLPQSSLLMLVSAFAEKDFILQAYRHAVEQRYRFYSYGDCMLLV